MATTSSLFAWLLATAGLLCWCSAPCLALRDVLLQMPPVAFAGSSVTLRCLYDLENDKLYAVKWYRGNFEFYRATPHERPAKQAFPYPDFHVDMSRSDDHQVTLNRVPQYMSGKFSCEVSTDAPKFTTIVKNGQLEVLDTVRRPLLTVSKDLYRVGDVLEANCTSVSPASADPDLHADTAVAATSHGRHHPHGGVPLLPQAPPLQPHQLSAAQRAHLQKDLSGQLPMSFSFWVNNKPVPAAMVRQGASSATLTRPVAEDDFSEAGELRIKCSVTLADKYREPSHAVTVRRQEEDEDEGWEDGEEGEEGEDGEADGEDGVAEPAVVARTHAVADNAALPDAATRSSDAGAEGLAASPAGTALLMISALVALFQLQR